MSWPAPETISAYADLLKAFQWPLVALIVSVFFRHQIRSLISRIKSGELFGQKFQIADDLESLKAQVEEISKEATGVDLAFAKSTHEGEPASYWERTTESIEREILEIASLSPRAAVMVVGAEIEQYMRWIAAQAEYDVRSGASVRILADAMVKAGVLSLRARDSLDQFWKLRNRIVHEFAGDDKENLAAQTLA